MPYQYTITEHSNYLRAKIFGSRIEDQIAQDAINFWTDLAGACRRKNIDHVLTIFHVKGQRSLMATFDIIEGVQELLWDELKVAYVDLDDDNKQENSFAETSTRIHGITFRAFDTEEEAKRWLKTFASSG